MEIITSEEIPLNQAPRQIQNSRHRKFKITRKDIQATNQKK